MNQWQRHEHQNSSDNGVDTTLTGSTKWIVQMWTHQHQYNAVLPPGNSNEAARPAMEEAARRLGYNIAKEPKSKNQ